MYECETTSVRYRTVLFSDSTKLCIMIFLALDSFVFISETEKIVASKFLSFKHKCLQC